VAVPLLAGAARLAIDGSRRALLVWSACSTTLLYAYAYYVFGAAFNRFFLMLRGDLRAVDTGADLRAGGHDAGALSAGVRPAPHPC
jgi:hypothetical protein